MKHDVTIKATGLSPNKARMLIDSVEGYTTKITVKPALKQANVIGSASAGYQFMYYLSDEDYMQPEPKYRLKYIKAKSIDAAIKKFLARKPKSLTRLDYEVEKDGQFIDISNVEALRHYL